MRKLGTTGLKSGLLPFSAAAIIALLAFSVTAEAQPGCVMSCPPMAPPVEISLSSTCSDVLTPELIGVTFSDECSDNIEVDIMVNGMSIGDVITGDMIGQTFMVLITDLETSQSCMASITVVDKQAPLVTCPEDITLSCAADLDSYSPLLPEDISDCSETNVSSNDVLVFSMDCVGDIVSQYMRTYIISDIYNNATTCEQLISLEKAELGDVVFPADLIGPDALHCFPLPDTVPANTGYPTINGDDIINGSFCNLSAIYSDLRVPLCSGAYKLLRTWTVVDWCNNNESTTSMQTIEVLDTTPPVVLAPANLTISTGLNCLAMTSLQPAVVSEDCSSGITVRMQGPFGTIHTNGGPLPGLSLGTHEIIFIATNDCGLVGSDTMYITVEDLLPPTPVCNQLLAIPVNQFGTAYVPASVFNGGSADNCGEIYVKVKRMNTPSASDCFNQGNPENLFDDFVQFCCEDIPDNNVLIILRVYDVQPVPGPVSDEYLAGHFNDCMVQVEVQDKFAPELICPSDLTISCEFPFTEENLSVFGSIAIDEDGREDICIDDPGAPGDPGLDCIGLDGLATDNCFVEVEELEPVIEINNCGVGSIIRTFSATDAGGLVTTCQQVITVTNFDLFDPSQITWPLDYTTSEICEISLLDPEDLDPPYNQPTLNGGPCDMVGANKEDAIFDFSNGDGACFKILRTWTVMDWCQLNTETVGIWSHVQVIKVMNTIGPDIESIPNVDTCSLDPQCVGLEIDFEAIASDDCSGPGSLTWRYFIDIDNNQTFDYSSGEITGEELSFSRFLPIGNHRVLYVVDDLCGNETTTEQLVTIRSCKPPSAKCIHGLSTNLMAMDTDGDGTADWGMVTLQAEMFDGGSDHPCGNPFSLAFSADPLDVTRVFDCGDLGENEIELWAIDENGLGDFCITTIDIQDNFGICPPIEGGTGTISGNIAVPGAGTLSGAMIYLDGSNLSGIPSGSNGHFVFPAMPLGGEYVVRPVREGDVRNGVSTLDLLKMQKHLLGLETFTTPFQYIAADINNSESVTAIDIIQLRKLILGYYDVLPNNQSWRFIDKAHVFPDPQNPWLSDWAETYSIIPFSGSMNDVDFNAVKIGDINLSANLLLGSSMILPRGNEKCEIEYTVHAQEEENIYRVDISLLHADDYSAIQFSFNWNQSGFKVLDWKPGASLASEDIRMPVLSGENASISTFDVDGWQNNKEPLLTIWVESISAVKYPFQLFLSQAPTMPVAYTLQDDHEMPIQLLATTISTNQMDNRPNPFSDMTTIRFVSTQSEPAILRVIDLDGRLIYTRQINLLPGDNEFVVRKSEVKGAGIFMYEIESDLQYSTNRMIIVD